MKFIKISIKIIDDEKEQIVFEVSCSKGTYIRSLCEDIAEKLGTIGYMQELNRIQVGEFSINQACKIEVLEKGEIPYISIEELMKNKEKISVEKKRLQPFLNGVKLTMKKPDGAYRIYCEQEFIGIGVVCQELLKRDIIL